MSANDDLPHSDFAEASAQLDQGLKTCRTVVDNYRSMLKGVTNAQPANDDEQSPLPPIAE